MTTKAQDSEIEEGTEARQAESSDNSVGQRSSATEPNVAAQLAELNRKYDALSRSLQSDKDRAVKQTNQRLDVLEGDIREILQGAQRDGKNVGDLLSELDTAEERQTRQMLSEMAQAFKSGRFPQSFERQSEPSGVDVSGVLKELELDGSEDLRVQEFKSREFKSEAEAFREAAKLAKTIYKTQPSDADKASDVSKERQSLPKQEELMREYREGSKNLYGRNLLAFKKRMIDKGLEIS